MFAHALSAERSDHATLRTAAQALVDAIPAMSERQTWSDAYYDLVEVLEAPHTSGPTSGPKP
jgi:hypothetical protein